MTHIERYCRATYGYGPVADVRVTGRPPDDKMESFFLAETLKYLYMLLDSDHGISPGRVCHHRGSPAQDI